MWNSRNWCALILLTISFQAGCGGGSGAPPQMVPLDVPDWPELTKLGSSEIMKPIHYAKEFRDEAGLKKALLSVDFENAIDKFARSTIPAGYEGSERKAAKDEVVAKYRKAIDLARSNGSFRDIRDAVEDGADAYKIASAPRKKK